MLNECCLNYFDELKIMQKLQKKKKILFNKVSNTMTLGHFKLTLNLLQYCFLNGITEKKK